MFTLAQRYSQLVSQGFCAILTKNGKYEMGSEGESENGSDVTKKRVKKFDESEGTYEISHVASS